MTVREWGTCKCGNLVRPDHLKKDREQLCGKCYLKKKQQQRRKRGLK